jgi:hypothetical protein
MVKKSLQLLGIPLLVLSIQGCLQDPASVTGGQDMQIRIQVSGGFAGADYAVILDGADRILVGDSCSVLCNFTKGQVLASLTPEQVDYVWELFQDANVQAFHGEDFGTQCCDQFYWVVDYLDAEGPSVFKGTSSVFPHGLNVAVSTVLGMAFGTLPIIVDFDTEPSAWPGDAFQIQEAAVSGHTLHTRLSYGGGCKEHEVRAVAWGGWMESFPVQVRLFLSHDAHEDPCDAWITRDFTFDLRPLKASYQASYGVGEPGETTLILLLADPMLASPQGARRLEYRF